MRNRWFFISEVLSGWKIGGKTYLALTLLLQFAIFSCSKNKVELFFTDMNVPVTNDLNSIFFINDSIGFACGGDRYEKGDLVRTTDGGFTWTDLASDDMSKALYKIAFSSADTGFACGYDGKIFRTYDGGLNWHYYQAFYWRPIRDISILNHQKVFACGGEGWKSGYLLNSENGGDFWNTDTSTIEYRGIVFFNDSVGLLAGYGTILRTTDGGAHWKYTDAEHDFFVSMHFVNENVGYAVGYTGSILKTTDGGISWEQLRNSNSLFRSPLYFTSIIFRDENTGYIVGERGCFLKTEDGGGHWSEITNAPNLDMHSIALVQNGGFVCGANGKIYRFVE